MTDPDQVPYQRHRHPRLGSMRTLHGETRVGSADCGRHERNFSRTIQTVSGFIVAVASVSSIVDAGARMMGLGFGVSAAPCIAETTAEGSAGGVAGVIGVSITPDTDLDLTSIFNCEDGDFEVAWSGAVNVSGTILIGSGTTVNIVGEVSSHMPSDPASITEGTSSLTGSSIGSITYEEVDSLTADLSIPRGLSSAAVGVGLPGTSANTDEGFAFGPIFHVDGGELILENMAVRGGFADNSTFSTTVNGGGVNALNSNVTATNCEFEDNFAEFYGGGVFANQSNLVIIDSVFRRCRAGFQSKADDDNPDGAGGGIGAEYTNIFIDGCLFEECYSSKKGGGVHQGIGQTSVLGSVFNNNSAGSDNVEDETEIGEGAALSFTTCALSFDGQSSCEVTDTIIANSHVGRKGGAVAIGSGNAPSHVEFHRCTVANSTTGRQIEDDPQGEGGAFSVGRGITLVLSDCTLKGNYCGNKGGAITLSSGGDWIEDPGPTLIVRNSTFDSNKADLGNAGVVYLGEFSFLLVEGDRNVFEGNTCGVHGAVFGGTTNTNITVEGGVFSDNAADKDGGVMWTKGRVEILGGLFVDNEASDKGGVVIAGDDSTTILAGGVFEKNSAIEGGVVYVGDGSNLSVGSGTFYKNEASNTGGVFSVSDGGNLKITGGNFSSNEADFGGFLHKEGDGTVSCEGASILLNKGVDGGAIHAVQDAVLDWACDLRENSALAGPAIYAREDTTVTLRRVSLLDNDVARGSVILVVDSHLRTYQVNFKDTKESSDLSAVQVDAGSTYLAEDTSFEGFDGEAIVFSEGKLFLDDCDFSGSTAGQLVYAKQHSTVMIRNTVLGDNNYVALAEGGSSSGTFPTADSLTNTNITCRDGVPWAGTQSQDDPSSSLSSSEAPPCSNGSACLEGDLGVYCPCYIQRSSLRQRCVAGDAATLDIASKRVPGITFFPEMLEGDLILSLGTSPASARSTKSTTDNDDTESSASSSGLEESDTVTLSSDAEGSYGDSFSNVNSNIRNSSNNVNHSNSSRNAEENGVLTSGGSQSGVVWSVSALQQPAESGTNMMEWTVFPSSGLLLPGESITLRVVTLPSIFFDGTAPVTFAAEGFGMNSSSNGIASTAGRELRYSDADKDAFDKTSTYSYLGSTTVNQAKHTSSASSEHSNDSALAGTTSGLGSNITSSWVSFNVTFFHCDTGQVWNPDSFSLDSGSIGSTSEGCQLCSDVVQGETEGVVCDDPGATIRTLPVEEGYWRAALDSVFIRECSTEAACKGGSAVASVQEYCDLGYKGPECAVCTSGYGRGVATECHRCTPGFKAGMYLAIVIASFCSLVVMTLLVVYLVGGRGAVSSTVANTKESVRVIQRRGKVLLVRSDGGGRIDFGNSAVPGGTRPQVYSEDEIEMSQCIGMRQSHVHRGSNNSRSAIDTTINHTLEGRSGSENVRASSFSVTRPLEFRPVVSERPAESKNPKTGLAATPPTQHSDSLRLDTLAGNEGRETVGGETSHGGKGGASGTGTHRREGSVGITRRRLAPETSHQQTSGGPPRTEAGVDELEASIQQTQSSLPRERRGPAAGIDVERSTRNPTQQQSRGRNRAEQQGGNGTAAARIGNILAGLPLSKLKIVIVVWQISSSYSNITNVAYPPIYEKFLSIIGVFNLDLAWILSAACLTTNVNFYHKLLMVTIGPLVVLGILGITFHVGARPLKPAANNVPVNRSDTHIRQPATSMLQPTESSRSESGLRRVTAADTLMQDALQAVQSPTSQPVLENSGPSGGSEDTIGLSRSQHQRPRVGASAGQHREAAETSKDYLALSLRDRPAPVSNDTTNHHQPAGKEQQASFTNDPSASSHDVTANEHDFPSGIRRGEEAGEAGLNLSASRAPAVRSLHRSHRLPRSVWKTGPGPEADQEQDRLRELFARHTTMTLILLYLIYSQVSTVEALCGTYTLYGDAAYERGRTSCRSDVLRRQAMLTFCTVYTAEEAAKKPVFQTFSCENFAEINKGYLRADRRIECDTTTHMAFRTYAAFMIFLYPLGIPAAFLFLLSSKRSSINPPTDVTLKEQRGTKHVMREKIKQRSNDVGIAPTSFLWSAYYPNRYYYEVVECLRRLVLTGLLVFLVPDTPGQIAFSCVFAFASLLAFELQRPHIDHLEIQLYRTGCLVIFFTNFLALMIKAEVADEHSAGSAIYSVVLILVNILYFLSIWWNTWATTRLACTRRGFQGAVMGLDVFGEDTVDTFLGPNKKNSGRNASHQDGQHVNTQSAEDRPTWDGTADDIDARADSSASTRRGARTTPRDKQPAERPNCTIGKGTPLAVKSRAHYIVPDELIQCVQDRGVTDGYHLQRITSPRGWQAAVTSA